MSLFEWQDSYSVGINNFDEQHKKLIDMLNNLHGAMIQNKGKSVIEEILQGLSDYTVSHFKAEEMQFDQHAYPEKEQHKNEHANFVKEVTEFKTKHEKGSSMLSIEILNFLKDWLVNHINGSDKSYGPFLNSRGVK